MLCIVLNIVTMAMTYENSPASYVKILENINLFFTSVFIMETTFKLVAFGPKGCI
jgi:flagellar biosynthesis protein FliP